MKDALDGLDAQALTVLSGRADAVPADGAPHRRFEGELAVQEANITESGEKDTTRALRAGWNQYAGALRDFTTLPGGRRGRRLLLPDDARCSKD